MPNFSLYLISSNTFGLYATFVWKKNPTSEVSLFAFGFTKTRNKLRDNGTVIPEAVLSIPKRAVQLANAQVAEVNNKD